MKKLTLILFIIFCFIIQVFSQTELELCSLPYDKAINNYLEDKESNEFKIKIDSSQLTWKTCITSKKVPRLEVKTVKNSILKIDTTNNTIYVFQFWASWCPPCMAEIPIINKLLDDFKNTNVLFITFSYNEKIENENISKFRNHLVPNSKVLSKELGVLAFPTIYLISKKLEIKKVFMGANTIENETLYITLKNDIQIELDKQ